MSETSHELPSLLLQTPRTLGFAEDSIPKTTGLFRSTVQLPAAVRLAEERIEGDHIDVASTPCSTGGELDSALSLLRSTKFGSIAAKGVDIDARVVELARQGKHQTRWTVYKNPEEMEWRIQSLEDRGFVIDAVETRRDRYQPGGKRGGIPKFANQMRLLVDANPLREGVEVEFERGDLADPNVLPAESRDLVLVNNLLYHLDTQTATDVLWNLAGAVRPNGILSLGDEPYVANNTLRLMHSPDNGQPVAYKDWLDVASGILSEVFQLEPIAHDRVSGRPTLLAKASD